MLKADTNYVGATTGNPTPQHGQRRRHNFGDRVYKLTPEETPFFAYLNAVGKYPTDDPVFRVLEDRAPTKWADRSFEISKDGSKVTKLESTEGGNWKFDTGSANTNSLPITGGKESELVVGMLIQANVTEADDTELNPRHITGRITAVGSGTIEVQTVDCEGADLDITGAAVACQVIGTAWGEGTLAPTSFGYGIDDTQGYTQIFKTSAHMSNTAMATKMRGYASEWDRTWAMKLREHKVDIERAFLYNAKGITGGVQYSDGIIGHILKKGTFVTADGSGDLAYAADTPYCRTYDIAPGGDATTTQATYDNFLKDFEVIFAPERGGSSQKFCMASLPVVTYMNQLKNGFMGGSTDSSYSYNLDFSSAEGGLGHKVMKVDTVHGSIAIVKNPLLKGTGSSLMVGVDLDNVKYRPLVGNGVNRDTYIDTNVQTPDEDSRKDLILTEAGLEVCMAESHFIMNFANNASRL